MCGMDLNHCESCISDSGSNKLSKVIAEQLKHLMTLTLIVLTVVTEYDVSFYFLIIFKIFFIYDIDYDVFSFKGILFMSCGTF